jgi:hypothetical protein
MESFKPSARLHWQSMEVEAYPDLVRLHLVCCLRVQLSHGADSLLSLVVVSPSAKAIVVLSPHL